MGNLTSQEITKIFLMLESKSRRKFQGDHTFSTKDTELLKKMFQVRYPSSVLIIEPERFNIGTYQIRFSDTDFESIPKYPDIRCGYIGDRLFVADPNEYPFGIKSPILIAVFLLIGVMVLMF